MKHIMRPIVNLVLNPALRRTLHWASHCTLSAASIALILLWASVPARADDWIYFTVKGDTLWDLCLKYTNKRGCWIELGRHNKVANDRAIPIGTEIRIPAEWLVKPPVVGRVLAVSGDVTLERRDGERLTPEPRELLYLGDTLASGEGSARVKLGQGDEVLLRPGSEFRLENLSSTKSGKGAREIELKRGNVDVKVLHDRGTRFQVDTPAAVAAVRGTDFRVSSSGDGGAEMRLEVLDGRVRVDGQVGGELLERGEGIKVREGRRPGEVVELLPAPAVEQAGATLRPPYSLSWNSSPGAERWYVDIRTPDGEHELLETRLTPTPGIDLEGLEPQCYQVEVSAIDSQDFRGFESANRVCLGDALDVPPAPEVLDHQQTRRGHDWSIGWQAVEGAVSYRVQVARDERFEELVLGEETTAARLPLSGLANGEYYLRVAAVDDKGVQGRYSEALAIHQVDVLGAGLFAYALFLLVIF